MRPFADGGELAARRQAGEIGRGIVFGDGLLETRYANHEELVEVRRRDGGKLDALEQRYRRVGRFLEHALVEGQPRQLAVDEEAAVVRVGRRHAITPAGRMTS